ncbi:MAG: galactokinase [bacterium]
MIFDTEPAAERAPEVFRRAFGTEPHVLALAPGRVNLIGEHVDYNGGIVLPVAIDRYVAVAARWRKAIRIRMLAVDRATDDEFRIDTAPARGEGWARYARGIATLLVRAGYPIPGADIAFAGDVPIEVGLASSAALVVATAKALLALAGVEVEPATLAEICRRAEAEWVGVRCGIMDPFIALHGRAGHALLLDCRTLDHYHLRLPDHVRLVATDSGVPRALRNSEYNQRRTECRLAAIRLGVPDLRDISLEDLERRGHTLAEPLFRRARHVVREIERARLAAAALEVGDVHALGRLMNESHVSLRDDLDVSTPELDTLVRLANEVPGVYGSRLCGAGFGGCTVSLVDADAVKDFARHVTRCYRRATGGEATVYVLSAGDGARWEKLAEWKSGGA